MKMQLQDGCGEVRAKLDKMRAWLVASNAGAIRLRGVDWFSWATAGGSNVVLNTVETGVAELLVTAQEAYVLTDEIEVQRLQDEEVPSCLQWHVSPWAEPWVRERFVQYVVREVGDDVAVMSDRPCVGESALPFAYRVQRMCLFESEQARYRDVGRLAAQAMSEVMRSARPDWTECELAGAGAEALYVRGLHPALVLAAGAKRVAMYRHPTATPEKLGSKAMLVFCARCFGLVVSLTRFVYFTPLDHVQRRNHAVIRAVEAAGLQACRAGRSLVEAYQALDDAYRNEGFPHAILEHHQGGLTGYLAREVIATGRTDLDLENGMAIALNPSLPGVKIEDTFLLLPDEMANLTLDADWPSVMEGGRPRPLPLEAT